MANFEIADKKVALIEAGYTNNPSDRGNWTGGQINVGVLIGTNFGISAPVLCTFLGRQAGVLEMKHLSADTAKAIRHKNYWQIINGDQIVNQDEANSIYDSAINLGPQEAIKLAQRAAGLPETGHMDSLTLQKLNFK